MLTDAVREVLRKPLLARLSTIDSNGYPHTVPLWFDMDGDDIVIISDRNTVKIRHIGVNPKGAFSVGGDTDDGGGYLFKGILSVEEDPDFMWTKRLTYRYEEKEQAEKDIEEWTNNLDMVVIRMKVHKVAKVI